MGIESMTLGYEKLDIYRLSIGYVAWVYEKATRLKGVHRPAQNQLLRASQSIPLNIAEENDKTAAADRRRYFEIARVLPWNVLRFRMLEKIKEPCSAHCVPFLMLFLSQKRVTPIPQGKTHRLPE